ncbi:MAG TPA: hypothetical protein VF838_13875, partial [Trebonia sp.]
MRPNPPQPPGCPPGVPSRRAATPAAPERADHPSYTTEEIARVVAARERWTEEELAEALARLPRRKASFQTDSGIPVPDVLDPGH